MRLARVAVGALLASCGPYSASPQMPGAHGAFPRDPARFAAVQLGMRPVDVQALLGPADGIDLTLRWNALPPLILIPTPDAWRTRYRYRGLGRVVFSCWLFDGDGKVRAVEVDPTESAE